MEHNKKTKEENANLSIKESFKNGLSNIKNKKVKFVFAVVLIVITLISISVYDAMLNYEDPIIKNHTQLLVNNNEQFVQIEKSDLYYKDDMTINYKKLTEADVKQINQKLKEMSKTGKNIYKIASLNLDSNDVMGYATSIYDLFEINPEFRASSNPYTYWRDEFDIVEWDDFRKFFINDITGRMPANNDEVMISNYFADLLLKVGLKSYGEDNYYKPASYEELIASNKYLHFGIVDKVKIVGIINYDLSEFQSLKNIGWEEYNLNFEKYNSIFDELMYKTKNIYNKIFVNNEFISHLNVNDKNIPGTIWQNKITKTGILVMENSEKGFLKLLNEFRYDNPITARSSYSELVDTAMETIDSLPDISLISNILFYVVIILTILSIIVISRFILSKQDLKELNNQKAKKLCVKEVLLWNIILIAVISVLLSFLSLICLTHFFKTSVIGDNAILNQVFILSIRQFVILFSSMIGIGMISYLISIIKLKITYKNNA